MSAPLRASIHWRPWSLPVSPWPGWPGRPVVGQTGQWLKTPSPRPKDAFANLGTLIDSLGASPSDIACLRTYLTAGTQEGFYQGRDQVFSRWFPDADYPVNTLVVIIGLADPRAVVEVEAVVALPVR